MKIEVGGGGGGAVGLKEDLTFLLLHVSERLQRRGTSPGHRETSSRGSGGLAGRGGH